jgi:hypothetical protein
VDLASVSVNLSGQNNPNKTFPWRPRSRRWRSGLLPGSITSAGRLSPLGPRGFDDLNWLRFAKRPCACVARPRNSRPSSPMPRGGRRMRFYETKPKLLAYVPAALSYENRTALKFIRPSHHQLTRSPRRSSGLTFATCDPPASNSLTKRRRDRSAR